MNEHYLYIHRRVDNNLVFYIGIGKKDRSKRGDKYRNKNWKAVCKEAGGFVVEYLSTGLSREQALELENKYLDNPPEDWKLTNIKKSEKVKNLTDLVKKIRHYFEYDESSPSCLIWKNKYKNSQVVIGNSAGHLNKKHGYYEVSLEGRRYYAHRVVYLIFNDTIEDSLVIDHIDNNPSNNKISNLRLISQSENCRSRSKTPNSKTGVVGVQLVVNKAGNEYFQSSYVEDGKAKTKLFSVKKLGRDVAFELAKKFREEKYGTTP